MGGKLPVPTHIRLLKNDKAHAHLHKNELQFTPGTVVAPDTLSDPAKEIFYGMVARLEELGIASPAHTEMLAMYAQNAETVEYLNAFLRGMEDVQVKVFKGFDDKGKPQFEYEWVHQQRGFTYRTTNKLGELMIKNRPEATILADCQNRCIKILDSFGLSPVAAVRVKVKPQQKKVNAFADLDDVGT